MIHWQYSLMEIWGAWLRQQDRSSSMPWRWRPGIIPRSAADSCRCLVSTYTIDSSVNSSVKLDEKGNFISVNGPYRVKDIMVNGEPIDLSRTYTVASHNYMLKSGGDGMTMFNGCNVIKDEVMVDVDVLSSYIRSLGGAVTAEYADPLGQGRIRIQ